MSTRSTVGRTTIEIDGKAVEVTLTKVSDDSITLDVNGYHVFALYPDGTGHVVGHVSESTGLRLDEHGKILLAD